MLVCTDHTRLHHRRTHHWHIHPPRTHYQRHCDTTSAHLRHAVRNTRSLSTLFRSRVLRHTTPLHLHNTTAKDDTRRRRISCKVQLASTATDAAIATRNASSIAAAATAAAAAAHGGDESAAAALAMMRQQQQRYQ
jgi:hypothetical protein